MMTAVRRRQGGSSNLTMDQIMSIRSLGGNEVPQWTLGGKGLIFVAGIGGSPEIWSVSTTAALPVGSFPLDDAQIE